jgi:hypothetical protein
MSDEARLWAFLPVGYLLTICVEIPVLLVGLRAHHPFSRRLAAGFWLTACTYPIVVVVLPSVVDVRDSRAVYLLLAETFAPVAECALFWFAFVRPDPEARGVPWRDLGTITCANLLSFGVGEALIRLGVFASW